MDWGPILHHDEVPPPPPSPSMSTSARSSLQRSSDPTAADPGRPRHTLVCDILCLGASLPWGGLFAGIASAP